MSAQRTPQDAWVLAYYETGEWMIGYEHGLFVTRRQARCYVRETAEEEKGRGYYWQPVRICMVPPKRRDA